MKSADPVEFRAVPTDICHGNVRIGKFAQRLSALRGQKAAVP
jgi:hypothetical protein